MQQNSGGYDEGEKPWTQILRRGACKAQGAWAGIESQRRVIKIEAAVSKPDEHDRYKHRYGGKKKWQVIENLAELRAREKRY